MKPQIVNELVGRYPEQLVRLRPKMKVGKTSHRLAGLPVRQVAVFSPEELP